MKRLLSEPLAHFLVLGGMLFVAHGLLGRDAEERPGSIVISRGQLASMRESHVRTWQRAPTPEEWAALVQDRVREEVYYREALALGLDRDDVIIRRRLQQKLEFVTADIVGDAEPTDVELQAHLERHPDQFRTEQRFTFRQVFLSPVIHGADLEREIRELLAKLNGPDGDSGFAMMGDRLMVESEFTALPAGEVAKQFGETFATRLAELTPGRWEAPVESGFGVHLVFLAERLPGRAPALDEVRDAVRREWNNARRVEANAKVYAEMRARYEITIEDEASASTP